MFYPEEILHWCQSAAQRNGQEIDSDTERQHTTWSGSKAKRFKKEFPCVKEFSNFNFLGLSYLFDMIFCVLKPYFIIFCCFRPDCCIIQKKLLPCYFRSSSISINTQGHRKHILSFIFLLQQEGWSWMIWLSGRRYVGDREVNWAEPEFLPLSEYSKQAWSKTGIFVCFFSVFARLRLRMGIICLCVFWVFVAMANLNW